MNIHLDRYPDPQASVRLVILHGGAGYGRMMLPFARHFSALGIEVLAPDLPGYGLTDTGHTCFAYGDWIALTADLLAAEHASDGKHAILLGFSMGGILACQAAAALQWRGVLGVVATSLLDPGVQDVGTGSARWPGLHRRLGGLMSYTAAADRLSVPLRWVGALDRVTNDPEANKIIASDPLGGGGRVPWRFLRTYACGGVDIPALTAATPPDRLAVAYPSNDRLVPSSFSLACHKDIGGTRAPIALPDAGHIPIEADSMPILVQVVRDLVTTGKRPHPGVEQSRPNSDRPGEEPHERN
ncbi:alpha/beta hydrolase [Streptomyces sp. NPDC005122]